MLLSAALQIYALACSQLPLCLSKLSSRASAKELVGASRPIILGGSRVAEGSDSSE